MKFLKIFVQLLLLACGLYSCGNNPRPTVEAAEQEYDAGDFAVAQTICDSLTCGDNINALSVDELCRLSMLASRLADHNDEETNMAMSARCMQAAIDRQPDSVEIFIQSLEADDQPRSLFIRQLTHTAVDIDDIMVETDSITQNSDQ